MDKIKVLCAAIMTTIMSLLGILAVPVLLLVGCNLADYFTGLIAAKYRNEVVSSYKGIRGIWKKVCMWLLIVIGAIMDTLINYGITYIGVSFTIPFVIATAVAVWLIINEVISILENITDIGVELPPFLLPLVKNIKKQVEDKAGSSVNKED